MSFKSEAGTVRAGLKAGSYKQADPDPYGFKGFAEQVTFGIRAEAEQRRKEDLIDKQTKAAERKARAAKQSAKEAADKKINGYINRAMSEVTSGYTGAPSDPTGLAGMNSRVLIAVQDRGITTYKGVQDLLKSRNFKQAVDTFYAVKSDENSAGDSKSDANSAGAIVPVVGEPVVAIAVDEGIQSSANNYSGESYDVDGKLIPKTSVTPTVSDNLETAANSVAVKTPLDTQTTNLFGTSTEFDVSGLKADNWEAELDRVLKQGTDLPNKYPNAEVTAQKIRDVASSKGWVTYGGLSTADIRSKTAAELDAEIKQMEAGIGGQNVTPETIATLNEFVVAKKSLEQEGAFWNKPEEIFTKLADEKDRAVVEAQINLWKLTSDNPEAVKNIENAITIFDTVQNNKPLDAAILEKMVGADKGTIAGLKAIYYDKASGPQKLVIQTLESLAGEKDAKDRKPKELAFTSWAGRTGLAGELASPDEAVRKQAEKNIAGWEKLWSGRTSIAAKPVEWWQDAKNLSNMTLDEVELLLKSETITAEDDAEAYAALQRVLPILKGQSSETLSSTLSDVKTLDELNRFLIANEAAFEDNEALKATYTKMHVELQGQEAAANEGKTIDPKERARRQWMEDNQIANPSAMTFEQIGSMEKAVSELISPADSAEIITSSEMFKVGDSYVKRSTDGKLRDIFTNKIVEPTAEVVPVPISISREISKDYTRIRDDLLTPMSVVQTKSLGTIRSARRLSALANKNPEVLTKVGNAAAFFGRLSINIDTLKNYANQQLTPDQVVDQVMNEQLQGTASAQALFDAEILKYAYLYASANLGQSGRGLSDKDFEAALKQVRASDGKIETFDTLLRQLTNDTIGKVRDSIENIFGSEETGKGMNFQVNELEKTTNQPIGNYPRSMDEFVKFKRLQAEMAWLGGAPSSEPVVVGGNTGGNQGQTEFYGDGTTLEGVPEAGIAKSSNQITFLKSKDYSDSIIIGTLMRLDPKLSKAQAQLILSQGQ